MRTSVILLTTALVASAAAKPIQPRHWPSYQPSSQGTEAVSGYDCDESDEGADSSLEPTGEMTDVMDELPGDGGVFSEVDSGETSGSTEPEAPAPVAEEQPAAEEEPVQEEPAPQPPVEQGPAEEERAPAPQQLASSGSLSGPPARGGASGTQAYIDTVMYYHNIHRANHSDTQPLVWSNKLAQTAKEGVARCTGGHIDNDKQSYPLANGMFGYGQNWLGVTKSQNIGNHLNSMYEEELIEFGNQYGVANPRPRTAEGMIGHFTQMVWKDTKEVGCWTNDACPGMAETLCNFFPPGNYRDRYGEQVGNNLGKAPAPYQERVSV